MGELVRGNGSEGGPWGLLILTDKSFRFKFMPNEHWMLSLFRRFDKPGKKEKPVDIVVAREDIASVIAPKRNLFARIFGPAFPRFSVIARGVTGERNYSFSADPWSGIIAALEKVGAEGLGGPL
jgi:hypothetical protein